MMLDRTMIQSLMPHAGSMCLIDDVETHDDTHIVCTSMQHRSTANPLRRRGRLSPVHAIEFAAQAAALHVALQAPADAARMQGLLVSVRGCRLHVNALERVAGALRIEARRSAMVGRLASYDFLVDTLGGLVAEGRLGVHAEAA